VKDEPYFSAEPVSWGPSPAVRFIRPVRSARLEYGLPLLLFVLTIGTVYLHGGLDLVIPVISITLAHEMGHYLACRYYGVDATLPHFLPGPILSLCGTFGAFIRIRAPFPNRKVLFDVGVAGPIAGFLICLPVLYVASQELTVVTPTPGLPLFSEPLAFHWAMQWLGPPLEPGPNQVLGIGMYGLAAWFGLLLTALNLMPVGQLDGGHAMYALFRSRAVLISRIVTWLSLGLFYFGPAYALWWFLLRWLGKRPHPPTLDDEAPLGGVRVGVALLCVAIFVVSFTPDPFSTEWSDAWQGIRQLFGWLLGRPATT
jgi:membrane-associated protease RseP (regulator of RpoE activity)